MTNKVEFDNCVSVKGDAHPSQRTGANPNPGLTLALV
jgi:hypothetical protein